MDWFLYDSDLRHERVKEAFIIFFQSIAKWLENNICRTLLAPSWKNSKNGQTYFKNLVVYRKIFKVCLAIFQHAWKG